ncbi:hypothetical protein QFC20_005620 [Naganishia adeliensis]|uniref:Uncharacterized protein n=1 Tax=Naganishia adeliensis TaxID=92952 RepID=A0ACC2VKK5_9TREE|nr:hypothetical protein QFC20_005620 [Naganishia adeliensis]
MPPTPAATQGTSGTGANPAQSAVTADAALAALAAAPAAPPAAAPTTQGIAAPDQSSPAPMPAPPGQPPAGLNPAPAENAGGPADPAAIIEVPNMAMAEVAELRATREPVPDVVTPSWQLGPPPGLPASAPSAAMPSAAPVVAPSSTDLRLAPLEGPVARATLNATEVYAGGQEGMPGGYAYVDRSKFSRILRLYEEAREKEMEHVMAGKLDPFDLWKYTPTIMRITDNIVEEPAVSVEVEAGGALQVKPKDDQETRKKRLAKLHGYCPNPLGFRNA